MINDSGPKTIVSLLIVQLTAGSACDPRPPVADEQGDEVRLRDADEDAVGGKGRGVDPAGQGAQGDSNYRVAARDISQTVNAGHIISSPNFRLVFTLGQPTQNQDRTDSPNFALRGGLIGATGSKP
jgi:hypothetical protein